MNTYNKPEDRHNWMTVGELAQFLGKSVVTIKRWVKSGKLEPPAERTPAGWAIWSPEQATRALAKVSRKTSA